MDKNAIKKYAVWARRELISRVSQKALQYGITDKDIVPATATSVNGVVLSAEEMKQRKALIEQINSKGYEQVMEEVAYTWFNRFIALRFMEVNGYLPSRVRVFTDENNAFHPQILTEAISLELDGLDMEKVYAFKDLNDDDGLFKYLIIVQCNALSPILPGMFQPISDYTELLFPDNLLREGSVIQQMISMIPEEDWKDAVQIIGWLYQYYNSEKKDDVFAALKKNVKITKENIPAATQLFTPDWIVRYMVENSLGRLWVEGHPNEELKAGWKYYLEEAEQEPEVQVQLAEIRKEYAALTPEQIKVIDPCCGSGHILAYLFDVLMQIYESYGYTTREAVAGIVENNLYGLDIDDRAAQLAYFAVMMKARQYDRRFFHRGIQPHVYAIVESNHLDKYALDYFVNGDAGRKAAMDTIIKELHDAKEYGSILTVTSQDWSALYQRFEEIRDDIDFSRDTVLSQLLPLVQVAEALAQKYDTVVTNPPYMGNGSMSASLSEFVKSNYPDSKSDLFACCIERGFSMLKPWGYNAMVTMHSWMFLSSLEKLRDKILYGKSIYALLQMDNMVMGIAFGTAATVIRNRHINNYCASFTKVASTDVINGKPEVFPIKETGVYVRNNEHFNELPGHTIAYWVNQKAIDSFTYPALEEHGTTRLGMSTANNDRFMRNWFEVSMHRIGFGIANAQAALDSGRKWFPYNKGGSFRKWYGNNDYIVNWENDGFEIRNFKDEKTGRIRSHNYNAEYGFRESLTWSDISSSHNFGIRYSETGKLFDGRGSSLFASHDKIMNILAFLCSKLAGYYLSIINQTMVFNVGDVAMLPISDQIFENERITSLANCNVALSKSEWDSFEYSWDFQRHPLIPQLSIGSECVFMDSNGKPGSISLSSLRLSDEFDRWQAECDDRFNQLKANEEELNRIFIDIYGLQDELTPEVEDKDVTVRKADLGRDIRSFISYAVGCMFGRYSLDEPGLAYAGGEWDASKYATFPADKDNIIPICDDEYFEDDIVGRFVKFVEAVYGADTLDENLRFIADALGGKGQSKDVIRNYFLNDFFNDHCKIYQKRPIYWQFDSGKKNGFKCLIYMHRYQPDTIARIRTDYVHEQQSRYRTAIADLEQRIASASTSERVKMSKRLKTLQEQATEIQGYEEKIHHLADQYIAIDLDDGVKVNYAKFQDVLAKIK